MCLNQVRTIDHRRSSKQTDADGDLIVPLSLPELRSGLRDQAKGVPLVLIPHL